MSNEQETKIQDEMGSLIDGLVNGEGLMDVHSVTEVNNRMRYAMLRIINLNMKDAAQDPKMISAWKAVIKDIDSAVFMLARLAQEDRHLDNEEMVAAALNAVSAQIRKNPYRGDGEFNLPDLPDLPDLPLKNEDELTVGLLNMDYEAFNEMGALAKSEADALETDAEVKAAKSRDLNRDVPLPPPLPGQPRSQ